MTAWGGAGKTALVTRWVQEADGAAERHVTEAITIAAPRGLVPAHCAALAARARIRATQAATTTPDPDPLSPGPRRRRRRTAARPRHQLPWHELDALRAHALLDQAEGIDRRWAAKADALHARLVPPGLDPDPLATVERLVAAQKAADANQESEALMADSWTSVQVVTVVVDALTPLTVAGLGFYVARASRRIEQVQWANQTVVTRRLDIFARLAPGLNQLLCFATFVGAWKEIEPRQAIATKRQAGPDHVRQPGAVLRTAVRRLPPVHDRPVRHVRHHWRRRPAARPDRLQMGRPPPTALVGRIHDCPVCHPRQRNR